MTEEKFMKKSFPLENSGTPFKKGRIKSAPNFNEEKKLWKQGCEVVVGLDEVGRGPLAGPVCAAAVCFCAQKQNAAARSRNKPFGIKLKAETLGMSNIRDSKQLTAGQREQWYGILINHPDIKWGIGLVSEKMIDHINIFQATKLAMKKAVLQLEKKIKQKIEFLILDGNFTIADLNISQKAIIKADEKVFSCAAASIIAKITRDRLMERYAKKFPQYGFQFHKGYGTRKHFEALKKHGACSLHRKSFAGIALRMNCAANDSEL
ncbi:MAG: ribonuclease HII [Candidatus Portnoybacteria bacterium]|nr:ribonuclease HII [Candidatus Portnoybacteria bacterium]